MNQNIFSIYEHVPINMTVFDTLICSIHSMKMFNTSTCPVTSTLFPQSRTKHYTRPSSAVRPIRSWPNHYLGRSWMSKFHNAHVQKRTIFYCWMVLHTIKVRKDKLDLAQVATEYVRRGNGVNALNSCEEAASRLRCKTSSTYGASVWYYWLAMD